MPDEKRCPQCGAVVTTQGLCPACLLKRGLESGSAPSQAAPPATPAELAGHFPELEIIELIGRGGMGAVYKARQKQLDRLVALKVLPATVGRDPAFAERFSREARALAKLAHPNIVAVHDFGQADGLYYFVMEFVDGLNLRQLLEAGKITPKEALAIVPQICDALQYAHDKGIVHRDIKPENVLLSRDGTVKIADFGLAKLVGLEAKDLKITGSGDVMGTPHYMAPEQVEHPQAVDHRADIYSLGVVFYQMLTGELPIGRFALPSSKVQIDVRLDEVVLRALEKEPELRYQQASQFKTHVETVLTTAARPVAVPPWTSGWEYKSKRTLWGLPLVHVATGFDPATGKPRVAKGIIAIGNIACGVVALGGLAFGGFAFGGLAIGAVAFGGGALGVFSLGGFAVAVVMAVGGLAVGTISLGGCAVGYYAYGGAAFGAHPLDFGANLNNPSAREFFESWAKSYIRVIAWIVIAIGTLVGAVISVLQWQQQRASNQKSAAYFRQMVACVAIAFLVLVVVALQIFGWRSRHRNDLPLGTWVPAKLDDSAGDRFAALPLWVTGVSQQKQVVIVDIVCEFGSPPPKLGVQFSGSLVSYPQGLTSEVAGVDHFIEPANYLNLAGPTCSKGKMTYRLGFILADEATAAMAAEQVRRYHIGKPRGLTLDRYSLHLFELERNAGRNAAGQPVREIMAAYLIWPPPNLNADDRYLRVGKLAFVTSPPATSPGEICVLPRSGSQQRRIQGDQPDFMPDGKRLLYVKQMPMDWKPGEPAATRTGIYIWNLERETSTLAFDDASGSCEQPSSSPDGTSIAYVLWPKDRKTSQIWTANLDGSGRRRLTETHSYNWTPRWSPDGKKIVFESTRDGNREIYVMDTDGQNQTNLTRDPSTDHAPAWSPDGRLIAYMSRSEQNNANIFVMNADGSAKRNLSKSAARDSEPFWSPDGQWIAFTRTTTNASCPETMDIWIMKADGTEQRPITQNSPAIWSSQPSWGITAEERAKIGGGAASPRSWRLDEKLKAAAVRLDELRKMYKDRHPVVQTQQEEIRRLQAMQRQLTEHPDEPDELLLARVELEDARQRFRESHPALQEIVRKVESLEKQYGTQSANVPSAE